MQEFRGINGRILIGQNELHILRKNSIDSVFHKENFFECSKIKKREILFKKF